MERHSRAYSTYRDCDKTDKVYSFSGWVFVEVIKIDNRPEKWSHETGLSFIKIEIALISLSCRSMIWNFAHFGSSHSVQCCHLAGLKLFFRYALNFFSTKRIKFHYFSISSTLWTGKLLSVVAIAKSVYDAEKKNVSGFEGQCLQYFRMVRSLQLHERNEKFLLNFM